jgi:Protein of unknown function (DUF2752)
MGRAGTIALVRTDAESRLRDLFLFAFLAGWLAYTRVFWTLSAGHLTLPACPFYLITGHPCPFCGGTRSFASMWQADVVKAARFYPLGPALFAGTFVVLGLVLAGLISGRTWSVHIRPEARRVMLGLAGAVLAVSWFLKLVWLGN